jgi:hypothetical protein
MKNSDSSQLGVIYENIVLMKSPIGGLMGGMDRMVSDLEDYEGYGHDDSEYDDDHNPEEVDPSEIHMARAELKKIAEYADKLYDKIDELEGLEGWVASKITKASDYISSVYHWLDYEQEDTFEDDDEYEDEGCGCHEDEEGCGY